MKKLMLRTTAADPVDALEERVAEQAATIAALNSTVAELRNSLETQRRLSAAVATGGQQGLADALSAATGLPVVVEDRWGNLAAWAGAPPPEPYPKGSPGARERLLVRLQRAAGPVREGGRWASSASHPNGATALIALVDRRDEAAPADLDALQAAAALLAGEVGRLLSLHEAQLRLHRDLVDDLLAGTDDDSAIARASAVGHDLREAQRVVVINGTGTARCGERLHAAVGAAARRAGLGGLVARHHDTVVLIAGHDPGWEQFLASVVAQVGGGRCRLAVSGQCQAPSRLAGAYQEARMAAGLWRAVEADVVRFDDLGVYRLLLTATDPSGIQRFVEDNLGALINYDLGKGSELVPTLHQALPRGANCPATARALPVHPSTLKYRLRRIREITGADLNCPQTRFNLQLATSAWQTLRHVGGG